MRGLILGTALTVIAATAGAEDAAVFLGVERYRSLERVIGGADVGRAGRQLAAAGYLGEVLINEDARDMRAALAQFQAQAGDADRLLVALSGQFVTDGTRRWLLSAQAPRPTAFDVAQEAISVETILQVLAQVPGRAILVIGAENTAGRAYDEVLRQGVGVLNIPQGVTVIRTAPRYVDDLLEDVILAPGRNVIVDVARSRDYAIEGFRPKRLVMQPADMPVDPQAPVRDDLAAQQSAWARARAADTLRGYQAYLRQFPAGDHAKTAEEAIQSIQNEPHRAARLTEEALKLDREARRSVQSDLSILGYNTRGVDGIFGRGSRSAVKNWQQQNGFTQTSYLTDEQIIRIEAQANRRSAELEAEAARKRAQQLRRDRAYWDETGASGQEGDLRAYVERFPDGIYADEANQTLKAIERVKLQQAAQADRDAWNQARQLNSMNAYLRYAEQNRQGAFIDEARARAQALQQQSQNETQNAAAIAAENRLSLTPLTRRLVEARLTQLRHGPGAVDGTFDGETRRAIRRFQQSRGLPETGYLDQVAVVQLLVSQ